MKKLFPLTVLFLLIICLSSCNKSLKTDGHEMNIRPLKDTIGFAQYSWQMDSLMARLKRSGWKEPVGEPWKMAVCPHDDYTYVGRLYPETLSNIKADRVIIIGVAHSAAKLGIEDSLVFDSHTHWEGPWGRVKVSGYRSDLLSILKDEYAMVSDTMHRLEHSLESLVPFLQYFNRNIEIVPVLVPAMHPDRMEEAGKALAGAINAVAMENKWEWGKDYAIVVTTDAVHYGTDDWGGKNYARFGCDDEGNQKARELETEIIASSLEGPVSPAKVRLFNDYTLNPDNHREYIWTWCGRYCIPLTLYTSYYLSGEKELGGELIGYYTSITTDHIPVDDLAMGRTAIATPCHWVGYAALGYR